MPRFDFNTYDGHKTLEEEGAVLSALRAARRWAIRLSSALIESNVARPQLGEDWRMEVFRLDVTVLAFRQPEDVLELQGAET